MTRLPLNQGSHAQSTMDPRQVRFSVILHATLGALARIICI